MIGVVTQKNLPLFIPNKVAGVAALISEARGISNEEAMMAFYASRTYKLLEREETKYWHYSAAQLFALYGEEDEYNKTVQQPVA